MQRRMFIPTLLALATAAALPVAQAQSPADGRQALAAAPFTIIAPFPPGGPVDTLARMLSNGLAARYKQVSIVDNRTGANGNIGIDAAKRAKADGHTLLVVPQGNLTINPSLMPKLHYSVEGDFVPVASLARTANVIAVHPSVPARNIAELVALAKQKPGEIGYASPGVGSSLHLAGELFGQQAGVNFLHVAYKGTAPGLNDVLGGTVPMIIGNLPTLLPHIQSGKLRALAVTDAQRSAELPDVPTLAEAGVKGVALSSWYGVMAPKGTPAAVVAQLQQDLGQIFNEPASKAQLQKQGLSVWIVEGPKFGDVIRSETAEWAPIIKSRGIEAQ